MARKSAWPPIPPAEASYGAGVICDAAWERVGEPLKLSAREVEITRGVFDNLTESALATSLHISEHTIHAHMNHIFRKLGITTRVQLVVRVMAEMLALTRAEETCLPPICANRAHGRCPFQRQQSR